MAADGQDPGFILPDQVHEERNFLRNVQNALGIQGEDIPYDDTMLAAAVWNLARLGQQQEDIITALQGGDISIDPDEINPEVDVIIEEIIPQVQLPDSVAIEGIQIDEQAITDAFREAQAPINRRQIYDESVSGSDDNLLSQNIRPMTDGSTFRASVVLDTAVVFKARVIPDDNPDYTMDFNQGGALNADSAREFAFDVDPNAEYNFRAGGATAFRSFRLNEVLVL